MRLAAVKACLAGVRYGGNLLAARHLSRCAGKSLLTAHTASPITAMVTSISMRGESSGAYADMISPSQPSQVV
jgi:hypothetical protein